MNVIVEHNGVDISSFVIDYKREQKICSGIGTLQLTLDGAFSTSITTWDRIDIFEEGIQRGHYYVSEYGRFNKEGTIVLSCQDGSKRLRDYYISDNYLVDYYSLSGYWIRKFLNEAGVSNTVSASDGVALSNNTALGMTTCLEQITTLLQMSGWYMYFDNATLHVGSFERKSGPVAVLNDTDILTIKLIKSDKMYRNRALVIGGTDTLTGEWIVSDKHKHTQYDYDNRDLRTAVVVNGAIPDQIEANKIAFKMLGAFGKITQEKHITLHGSRNIKIGDYVQVNNDIFSGLGLVTTVGVTMSSNGLITELVLDEKCPRLFACFSPQYLGIYEEYVYASTVESGVFRKPLDGTDWVPFSSGLDNLNIVDLYVNNGILSCIDSSGIAYTATEYEGLWRPISIQNLQYNSARDGGLPDTTFSGFITARGIIQDKVSNTIRIAADNRPPPVPWSYDHWGDTVSGIFLTETPGTLAWVVSASPTYQSVLASYPIQPSGSLHTAAFDIENDGKNDFISVATMSLLERPNEAYEQTGTHTYSIVHFPNATVSGSIYDLSLFGADSSLNTAYYYDDPDVHRFAAVGTVVSTKYLFTYTVASGIITVETYNDFAPPTGSIRYLGMYRDSDTQYSIYMAKLAIPNLTVYRLVMNILDGSYTTYTIFTKSNYENITTKLIDSHVYFANGFHSGVYYGVETYDLDMRSGTVVDEGARLTLESTWDTMLGGYYIAAAPLTSIYRNGADPAYLTTYVTMYRYTAEDTLEYDTQTFRILKNFVQVYNYEETALQEPYFPTNLNLTLTPFNNRDFNFVANFTFKGISLATIFHRILGDSNEGYNRYEEPFPSVGYTPIYVNSIFYHPTLCKEIASPNRIYKTGSFSNYGSLTQVLPGGVTSIDNIYPNMDSFDDTIYMQANGNGTLLGISYATLDIVKTFSETLPFLQKFTTTGNLGNFFLTGRTPSDIRLSYVNYQRSSTDYRYIQLARLLTMRRNLSLFEAVHESTAVDRLDISNNMPLVAAGVSLNDTYLLQNDYSLVAISGVIPTSGLGFNNDLINDFRYFDTTVSTTGELPRLFLYSTASGLSVREFSEALVLGEPTTLLTTTSGMLTQVESTTNRVEGQYLFTTTSGTFFQFTPSLGAWAEYATGLPEGATITRIRVDDRI